jgi:hypothetical protein
MMLEQFLRNSPPRPTADSTQIDPLLVADAFSEVGLVEYRADVLDHHRVALLCDMRTSENYLDYDCAVIVFNRVSRLKVDVKNFDSLAREPYWRSIFSSSFDPLSAGIRIHLGVQPDMSVDLFAIDVACHFVDLGLGDIPDFTDASDAEIAAGMPSWSSEFIHGVSFYMHPQVVTAP